MHKIKTAIKIIGRKNFAQLAALVLIDTAFFGTTSASKVQSYLVIVGFLLFTYSVYIVIYHSLGVIKLYGVPIKRKKRLALYITGILGLLIALQSIGELSAKDIVVMVPLVVISYAYLSYFKPNEQKIS